MNKKTFRWLWAFTLVAVIGVGCGLISNVTQRVGGIEKTAQSVATGVQSGRQLITTGEAMATNFQGNPMVQTAAAYVTQQAPGLEKTAQAFVTDQGPGLQKTFQSFVTQQGPGLEQTVQAFMTQDVPELAETAQAVATQTGSTLGQAPQDIPLVAGDKTSLVKSADFVIYFTAMDFKAVSSFYEAQMPANGWTKVDKESIQNADNAVLVFDRPSRKATITLGVNPTNKSTLVVITISQK